MEIKNFQDPWTPCVGGERCARINDRFDDASIVSENVA
jgi:hypothetical protein